MACDHVLLPVDPEGFACVDCGAWFETRMADWSRGPRVVGDLSPHYSQSAGRHFGSRTEMREWMARENVREVEVDPHEQCKRAAEISSDRVRHPENHGGESLADWKYRTLQASGESKEMRTAIAEAEREAAKPVQPEIQKLSESVT